MPRLEDASLAFLDDAQFVVGDLGARHQVVVQDAGAALADRAHGQLGLEGDAELAHHDHVERGVQRRGDLGGHGDPAPGQPQHDRVGVPQVLEQSGKPTPGVDAVREGKLGRCSSAVPRVHGRLRALGSGFSSWVAEAGCRQGRRSRSGPDE